MEDVQDGDPDKSERMGVKGRLYLIVFVLHFPELLLQYKMNHIQL